jgi:hypothetical protein
LELPEILGGEVVLGDGLYREQNRGQGNEQKNSLHEEVYVHSNVRSFKLELTGWLGDHAISRDPNSGLDDRCERSRGGEAIGDVLITEFMADNRATLDDEDGNSSDWIERFNTGPGAVDIAGWYLTDDPLEFTKWQFPSVTLAPVSFLLVFASSKDRAVAGEQLHANFGLGSAGDYLALIAADGATVVSEFAPTYPQQFEDFSYGLQQTGNRTVTTHVSAGDPCRWLVPESEIGQSWTATAFDDAS